MEDAERAVAEIEAAHPARVADLVAELQPYDLAQLLEPLTPASRAKLLAAAPPSAAAEALEHLDADLQYEIVHALPEDAARALLSEMGSDSLADLVGALHPKDAQDVLRRMPEAQQAQIRGLLEFPESSAGGRMTLDYIQVRRAWSAAQVIAHFRRVGRDAEIAHYVYVVDQQGRLVGVTSMRDVLLAEPAALVADFMHTQLVTVPAEADQEEAARILRDYDFGALPVVDRAGRLVGVISVDDVIDVLEEEATEDIQRIGGTQPLDEPYLSATLLELFRKRIGWLLILFVAAAITQNILQHYANLLDEVVALAFFIPMLIGTGGNAGSQAGTLVIRAMAVGEVTFRDFFRVVWREARLGLLLGGAMAIVTYVRAVTFGGGTALGLTVAATIAVIVLWTSILGAGLPLIGKRLGFDPAVFSAPMITTLADATGLLIYFQMALWIMGL